MGTGEHSSWEIISSWFTVGSWAIIVVAGVHCEFVRYPPILMGGVDMEEAEAGGGAGVEDQFGKCRSR
jgi:hypothetical protein